MGRDLAQDSSVCWDSGISGLTWVTDTALQTLTQAIEVGGVGPRGAGSTQCASELPTSLLHMVTCGPEGSHSQDGGGPSGALTSLPPGGRCDACHRD